MDSNGNSITGIVATTGRDGLNMTPIEFALPRLLKLLELALAATPPLLLYEGGSEWDWLSRLHMRNFAKVQSYVRTLVSETTGASGATDSDNQPRSTQPTTQDILSNC
jgi:hypothetical protein